MPQPSAATIATMRVPTRTTALKFAGWYAAIGALWILCSGWVLHTLVLDHDLEALLEACKGWFYVAATAFLLWLVLDRYFGELRRSAGQLQAREAQLRLVGDNFPNGYLFQYIRDASGKPRFTYLSAGVERVHGIAMADALLDAEALLVQIDPAQRPVLAAAEAESERAMSDMEVSLEITVRDGSSRRLHLSARPRRNPDGLVQWDGSALDVTDRHQMEIDLRDSRQFLADLIEHSAAVILVKDREGRYELVNRKWEQVTGLGREQALGNTDSFLFPGSVGQRLRANDLRVIQTGVSIDEEEILDGPQGQRVFLSTKFPLRTAEGALRGVCGMATDITERKRAEAALGERLELQDQLAKIVATVPGVIFSFELRPDGTMRVPFCTPMMEEIWGFRAEALREDFAPAFARIHPADLEGTRELIAESARTLRPWRGSFRVQHPTKGERWVEGHSVPRLEADGSILWHGFVQDVTERKQTEETAQRQAALIGSLLDCIPDLVFYKDFNGVYLGCNPPFERFVGKSRGEIVGRTDHDLFAKDIADFFRENDRRMLDSLALRHNEEWIEYPDGRKALLDTLKTPYRGPDGRLLGVLGISRDITERHQAQQALARLHQHNQLILNSAAEGILGLDLQDRHTFVNPAAARMLGYTADELLGLPGHDTWHHHHADGRPYPAAECEVRHSFRGETVRRVSTEAFWRKDGTSFPVDYTSTPVFDQGQVVGAVVTFSDITERKRSERALREREEQLQLFIEHAPVGIAMLDRDMRYLFVSRRWLADYRLSGENVVGRSHYEVFPDIPERWKEIHRRCLAGAVEKCEADPFPRADGTLDWVHWEIRPWFAALGEIGGLIIFSEVITERVRAESEIVRSEARYWTLFVNMHAGFVLFEVVEDSRGIPVVLVVLAANERFAHTTGLELQAALGQRLTQLLPGIESDATDWVGLYGRVAVTGEPRRFEQGSELLGAHFSISAFQPAPKQCAVTFVDVSERKAAEDALQQRNEELVRFTYTVSHDLKSPLVTIQTFLGYLEKDLVAGATDRIESDIGFMHKAADKMLQMLEELLELSRVGRKTNPPEEVTLQTLAAEAQELVAGAITKRQVQVRVTDVPILLRGDRLRLLEVFQNLLDNAVKFMGEQPAPQVEIGAEDTEQGPVLFVRDNGMGIDLRHQAKLFGLFEKLHPGTPGTGIGLALVKRIVETHGGRIWFESAGIDQGATFRFTLKGTKRC